MHVSVEVGAVRDGNVELTPVVNGRALRAPIVVRAGESLEVPVHVELSVSDVEARL